MGEPGGLEVLAEFIEGERAAAGGGDEHIEREQGAGDGLGTARVHEDVADGDASAGVERVMDFGEQHPILGAAVLMDDGAHPGEVGAMGQRIGHEIAGDQPDSMLQVGGGEAAAGHGDDMGQVQERRMAGGAGAQEGHRPGARGAADVEQMTKAQGADGANDAASDGARDIVHCPDERRGVAIGTPHTGHSAYGPAGSDHAGELGPTAQAVGLVLGHGQDAVSAARRQERCGAAGEGVTVALAVQEAEGGERVEQGDEASDVAAKAAGEGCGVPGSRRERIEQVEVGGGGQHGRGLVTPAQFQQTVRSPGPVPCLFRSHSTQDAGRARGRSRLGRGPRSGMCRCVRDRVLSHWACTMSAGFLHDGRQRPGAGAIRWLAWASIGITAMAAGPGGAPAPLDPVGGIALPAGASGFPCRDPGFDVLPGFRNPPAGYGEVPFWWWTGDPLDEERLLWQLDELHRKGVSGVQVNYAHEDSPGWPTYASEPPIFSERWWRMWGRVADACRERGMGIGLSTYTLDWTGAPNLFRRLFYSRSELNALKLDPPARQRLTGGQAAGVAVPGTSLGVWAYRVEGGRLQRGGMDLTPFVREGNLRWTAPEGEWEVCVFGVQRQANTLNPLLEGIGEIVVRDFYQRFQDATPDKSSAGLNYFFNDELQIGAGPHGWNADFAAEFQRRKGYRVFDVLPALWGDMGPVTPKARMDFADVRMALMEERYFQPIYRWHSSRGLVFACDSGGRGLRPDEFGDYFRATRWYTAPGHDTPGGQADLIKGKVSSSIASLYRRPRVWLEGYHSLGWGATPERLMFATRENFLYGCTLLNLHGLYYTTHGSFWEWAPPCYHFRMPYWAHMGVFLDYFERLSYLLSQGTFVCDVAVLYPVAPFDAGLDGDKATRVAFDTARALMAAGINFEFVDADSLARATVREGRLDVVDSSYRVLVIPAMDAVRWSSLEKAAALAEAGGLVLSVGGLPLASDRAGREDPELDALADRTFAAKNRLGNPKEVPPAVLGVVIPDTRAEKPVRSLHRKIGSRDVYMVMDAPRNSAVEFRAKGRAELWDPWTGDVRPLRVLGGTATHTEVELPLEDYEAQIVVFSPTPAAPNAPSRNSNRESALSNLKSEISNLQSAVPLAGEWEFELQPTMDNRFGDFRLPVAEERIGPEARLFRHAIEVGDVAAWTTAAYDDSGWERVTHGFGPQFWVLGPVPAVAESERVEAAPVNPQAPVTMGGKEYRWRHYAFSWRLGFEGDPGHQGWHGLKENVTDHFLCLGKRAEGLNETRYEPEAAGARYYLWTWATVEGETRVRIVASRPGEGPTPHASEILTPAAVFLNGVRIADLGEAVTLRAGANSLLVRYDRAGRGYFVLKRVDTGPAAARRTPLAMTWFDDPAVIPFDVHGGNRPAEWFRFLAPPGFRGLQVTARGRVEAWADGRRLRAGPGGRFEAQTGFERPAVVALRVVPDTGVSGGAVLPDPVRLDCGRGVAFVGDWSKVGALECYSGGAWYRKTVVLTAEQARGEVTLNLGKLVATAEVRVNGQLAGIRVAPPWRVDISKQVKAGENRIEVLVYNTLANHYRTIPTRYRGDLTSGLLGPVTLETAASH